MRNLQWVSGIRYYHRRRHRSIHIRAELQPPRADKLHTAGHAASGSAGELKSPSAARRPAGRAPGFYDPASASAGRMYPISVAYPTSWRCRMRRPRKSRDFTVPSGMPNTAAISA